MSAKNLMGKKGENVEKSISKDCGMHASAEIKEETRFRWFQEEDSPQCWRHIGTFITYKLPPLTLPRHFWTKTIRPYQNQFHLHKFI